MSDIHPVFHISQLRRCLRVPEAEHVPVGMIDLQPDLRYQEVPVKILDTVTRRTRNSEVRICRVQWSRHGVEEATWEREDADPLALVLGRWRVADEVKEGEEDPDSTRILMIRL